MPFRSLFALAIFALLLSSCQDHKPAIDTFGQLDSAMVAADTTMQVNLDRSYEYQKSLAKNDTEVYDFLAYDKPKGSSNPEWESKFIVIRRTSSAHDTIIKDFRTGKVQNLWLSDLNANGKPEIIFYEYPNRNDKTNAHYEFVAYETDGRNQAHKITAAFKQNAPYAGRDSFYIDHDHLIRRYASDTTSDPGTVMQIYGLSGGKFIWQREVISLKKAS